MPGLEAVRVRDRAARDVPGPASRRDRGRPRSTVADQTVPYIRPQENGGHAGVRWLELTESRGTGAAWSSTAAPGLGDPPPRRRPGGRDPPPGARPAAGDDRPPRCRPPRVWGPRLAVRTRCRLPRRARAVRVAWHLAVPDADPRDHRLGPDGRSPPGQRVRQLGSPRYRTTGGSSSTSGRHCHSVGTTATSSRRRIRATANASANRCRSPTRRAASATSGSRPCWRVGRTARRPSRLRYGWHAVEPGSRSCRASRRPMSRAGRGGHADRHPRRRADRPDRRPRWTLFAPRPSSPAARHPGDDGRPTSTR